MLILHKIVIMLEEFRLKVFVTLAQEHSFTKAADRLGVTQPAVSQNVSELEKELGVKLFQRLRGETLLTPEGEVFLKYARRLQSTASEAALMFSSLEPRTVTISASEEIYTYYIMPVLDDFQTIHPHVRFERHMFDDCDLVFSIRPSSGNPFDLDPRVIAKLRVSMWPAPKKMGDIAATHETVSYSHYRNIDGSTMFLPKAHPTLRLQESRDYHGGRRWCTHAYALAE